MRPQERKIPIFLREQIPWRCTASQRVEGERKSMKLHVAVMEVRLYAPWVDSLEGERTGVKSRVRKI